MGSCCKKVIFEGDLDIGNPSSLVPGPVDPVTGQQTITHSDGNGENIPFTVCTVCSPNTNVYGEGATIGYDVVLPASAGGGTLAAGDPVPAGLAYINEENHDGSAVVGETHVLQFPQGLTGSVAANANGSFTVTIDGDTIDIPDFCQDAATAGLAVCGTEANLLTDNCESVSTADLRSSHVISSCSQASQAFTVFDSNPVTKNIDSVNVLSQDQIGYFALGQFAAAGINEQGAIPAADILPSFTINLPPSTAGNVQIVHLTWGDGRFLAPNTWTDQAGVAGTFGRYSQDDNLVIGASTGTVSAPTDLGRFAGWTQGRTTLRTQAIAVDVTGTTGGTLDISFPTWVTEDANAPDFNGVIQWYVYDIAGPITVADLNPGAAITTVAVGPAGPTSPGDSYAAPAIDAGDCDAFYFGAGRHVFAANPDNTFPNVDTDWSTFDNAAVVEALDVNSFNAQNNCQVGSTAGLIPGGSGAVTYSYVTNANNANADPAGWIVVPIGQCVDPGGSVATTVCSHEVTNPSCYDDARIKVDISGGGCITAAAGAHYSIIPVINGVEYESSAFTIDNSNGAQVEDICVPIQITEFLPAALPPLISTTVDISFVVRDLTGSADPANSVLVRGWTSDVELVHV